MATKTEAPKYVTVKDVPLIRVGTWDASTGESAITREDLDNIVAAAARTDVLDLPVVKIGHTDPRFDNPDWDGEPAYGQVTNVRVTDDRDGTLVGDLVNVPTELAEKLDSAYPYRSVEIYWGVKLKDDRGKVLEEFPAVLTGLALLGESAPAVSGLGTIHADLSRRTMATAMTSATRSEFKAGRAMFALPGGLTGESLRRTLQQALWDDTPETPMYDGAWMEDYDDTQVWYHADGKMWQRGYTITDGAVVFATDRTEVIEKRSYVPVGGGTETTLASHGDTRPVPHAGATPTEPNPDTPPGASNKSPKEESAEMAFTENQLKVLRKQFGLADDATEDQVLEAIEAAATAEDADTNQDQAQADGTNVVPLIPPKPTEPPASATAASAAKEPTTSVTVSADQLSALTASNKDLATRLRAMEEKEAKTRRDGVIQEAFRTGRLHRNEVAAWRAKMDENEEFTTSLLSARTPLLPVTEFGHANAPAAYSGADAVAEAEAAADDALFGINTKEAK